ncbi:hypothetical protein ACVWYG_002527 [Pedobacter sp. UYEF25]
MICVAIFLFCAFAFSNANGQSYYYFVNEIPVGNSTIIYKTLLTLELDGTASARVQYNAGKKQQLYLYELNLIDSLSQPDPTNRRFLMCKAVSIPLLAKDSTNYFEPRFIFEKTKDSSGTFYEPAGVEIKNNDGKWIAVITSENKEKSFEELKNDEPFVSAFYFESDAVYKYLYNDRVRSTIAPRKEKMFLIAVANTNDETVGKSAAVDLNNVNKLFNQIASNLGIINVLSVKIYGNGYSKSAVEGALSKLKEQNPSPSDIIIFYYSGHGFRVPGDVSAYANLSFRTASDRKKNEVGDFLPLEQIYNTLMALKPRVCMVFGDCCNADIYQNPVFGSDVITPKGGGTLGTFNTETAKKLFLPTVPISLLIGSVQKGHLSVGNPTIGGYFTYFFTAELQKNLWGYYSTNPFNVSSQSNGAWLQMLVEARKNTYRKSITKQCGVTENDRCIQNAEIKITP